METIASLAGIKDVNYVTFDGDSAVAAGVLAGDLELGIITFSSGIDHAKTGKLKALFVNQTTPLKLTDSIVVPPITQVFPPAKDMPMLAEAWGVLIPADAPKRIIDKLEEAFRHALKQPRLIDYAKSKEQNVVGLSGEDAAKMLDYQFSAYAYAMYQPSRPEHVNPAGKLVKPSEWNWEVEKKKYGY
jgi:tripartite-type tricarboxylate transporter receptor subunit TctC